MRVIVGGVAAGTIDAVPNTLRRFVECYIGRKGWKEGGWGLLIVFCAGLYPLLSRLKERLEPKRHWPAATPASSLALATAAADAEV